MSKRRNYDYEKISNHRASKRIGMVIGMLMVRGPWFLNTVKTTKQTECQASWHEFCKVVQPLEKKLL